MITVQLPEDRKDLWNKFSPDHFPVWSYGLTGHNSPEYGGFYGFPRTKDGKVKIGCKCDAFLLVSKFSILVTKMLIWDGLA